MATKPSFCRPDAGLHCRQACRPSGQSFRLSDLRWHSHAAHRHTDLRSHHPKHHPKIYAPAVIPLPPDQMPSSSKSGRGAKYPGTVAHLMRHPDADRKLCIARLPPIPPAIRYQVITPAGSSNPHCVSHRVSHAAVSETMSEHRLRAVPLTLPVGQSIIQGHLSSMAPLPVMTHRSCTGRPV